LSQTDQASICTNQKWTGLAVTQGCPRGVRQEGEERRLADQGLESFPRKIQSCASITKKGPERTQSIAQGAVLGYGGTGWLAKDQFPMRCQPFLSAIAPFTSSSAREPWVVGKAVAGFLVALRWMPVSTPVQANSLWVHNGSTVELASDGDLRQFYYYEPKVSLARAGVGPGTLLFDGRSTGTSYIGTAYFLGPKCGRSSYEVSGPILNNQTRIVLEGRAPKVSNDCHVTGYFTDRLEFKFVRQINGSAVVQSPAGSGNRPPPKTTRSGRERGVVSKPTFLWTIKRT
jgi:hypothetical protein